MCASDGFSDCFSNDTDLDRICSEGDMTILISAMRNQIKDVNQSSMLARRGDNETGIGFVGLSTVAIAPQPGPFEDQMISCE
jgi:hypothetical protein